MKKNKKILFLDILTADKRLRQRVEKDFGAPYSEESRRALGLSKIQFISVDASKGEFPDLKDYDGVIISGSAEDPVRGQEKQWMKQAYRFILEIIKAKKPLLGICGGLQFTVRALGGKIVYNPRGRNFGTTLITLTAAGQKDNLFKGLPRITKVQSNHSCIISKLKRGWKVLAFSEMTPFETVALGSKVRLVQFHPERSLENMQVVAKPSEFKRLSDAIRTGKKIMQNFLNYFVR
ncbi:type 1 glutamine amidotransferase [Candidatus Jorgensenbacteria bacterium]|nr:type 1 glutamine amidotransferase [Candidatus Jorgensenbacteria bacterium]